MFFLLSWSNVLFFCSLLMGMVLAISSDSWFGSWCGLELNLMSFIPLICSGSNQYSTEGSLKYFLVQAFGSALVIFGSFVMLVYSKVSLVVVIALLVKLGASPTHFWFPQVMEGLDWGCSFLLMSVQKVAPMVLISYLLVGVNKHILYVSCIASAIVGAWGGYNQVLLRSLLAFSSINHMSWMLLALLVSLKLWLFYFVVYMFMSFSVVVFLYMYQVFHLNQLFCLRSYMLKIVVFTSLFSLGGLPPFTGFLLKWFVIEGAVGSMGFFLLLVLIVAALFTLYYYMRVAFFGLLLMSVHTKWLDLQDKSLVMMCGVLSLNFFGLLFPAFFNLF